MFVTLPAPDQQDSDSLVHCILSRRSIREYADDALPLSVLSQLLWSAQGVTGAHQQKATPSAGGLYPLHIRLVVSRVTGLAAGLYDYHSDSHLLERVASSVPREMQRLGLGDQPWLTEAAVVMGVAAKLEAATQHFHSQPPLGERGARYVYMESGALAQNVHLQSTALNVGFVLVAGFDDTLTKHALQLADHLEPTALLCLGHLSPMRDTLY
ncbi:SagB/ThcOx family dehydrogenase [Salinivibrio sp. ES.052]|uniref:SagB/ThcOx family dehydrogenase n=1 Tax=Salinivibrio sp. ES.052 TaxID=1882823 RepID=UPI000928C5F3|nr:SagB/ThcOx family dehydrogenase [Salinivibrio sp. ES.052]SIN80955.1 SagB-type dehydrogenase domain-containing protein [Salinivibrio sp. ES.052]